MTVWRTLHAEGMYPYHVQRVQHLRPGDFAERLNFCKWLNGSRQLHRSIMFTDEAQFNRDGVNNTHNSHVRADENPHATVESNFQQRFSVDVWCAVLDDQLIGPELAAPSCLSRSHSGGCDVIRKSAATSAVYHRAVGCVADGDGIFENQL